MDNMCRRLVFDPKILKKRDQTNQQLESFLVLFMSRIFFIHSTKSSAWPIAGTTWSSFPLFKVILTWKHSKHDLQYSCRTQCCHLQIHWDSISGEHFFPVSQDRRLLLWMASYIQEGVDIRIPEWLGDTKSSRSQKNCVYWREAALRFPWGLSVKISILTNESGVIRWPNPVSREKRRRG